ncbi:alpha/beta fold hydrolase [Lysobacter antibioticus]|uniref:alpha/beta fold hydrolase n=1 Tax=Lysobacter antibioticus TaxID=84531 RepID=UPI0003493436|nr:alpha/beta hydrolase [Lysobacter antibioticus]
MNRHLPAVAVLARRPRALVLALALALACAGAAPAASAADTAAPAPAATAILVHGAFADAGSWAQVAKRLQARGLNTLSVRLPLTSLRDDAEATRRALQAAPGPVVLVGHSWGGTVITEAGDDAKVSALVYVAAFAPDVGQNTAEQGRGYPTPPGLAHLVASDGLLRIDEQGMREDFAQDLTARTVRELFRTQSPIHARAFDDAVAHAAWKGRPSWYLATRQDRMIAPQLQTATAQRIGAQLRSVEGSHAAPLAHPGEVAEVILEAAGKRPPPAAAHEEG